MNNNNNKYNNLKLYLYQKIILNSTFLILNFKINLLIHNFKSLIFNFKFKNLQSKFLVNSTHRLLRRHLPYKGRQTPLTPIHRGGLGLLAFSLIELSIVLIIIGLLVAGVTGGKSLIDSAKSRALINEARNWKQAVNTFYAAQGRLPGDLNNDGIIGINLDGSTCVDKTHETYSTSSFSGYTTKAPDIYVAPFIDLSLEGVIDFVPNKTDPTGPTAYTGNCTFSFSDNKNLGSSLPQSKVYKNLYWTNFTTTIIPKYTTGSNSSAHQLRANSNNKKIFVSFFDSDTQTFKVKTAQKIDEKIDDGDAYNGSVRSICVNQSYSYKDRAILFSNNTSGTYKNAIAGNVECSSMAFEVF